MLFFLGRTGSAHADPFYSAGHPFWPPLAEFVAPSGNGTVAFFLTQGRNETPIMNLSNDLLRLILLDKSAGLTARDVVAARMASHRMH